MALEIEDGTGKADAQSYADAAIAREFAAKRGVTLPASGTGLDPVEVMLVKAMDYLEALEPKLKGVRTEANSPTFLQALSWPRAGVRPSSSVDYLPDDQIPAQLVAAQCQLVMAIHAGFDLQPISDPSRPYVKRKKLDVLETEYFSPSETGAGLGAEPKFPAVDALLRPLMKAAGFGAIARRG